MDDRVPTMRSRLLGRIANSWIDRSAMWKSEAARRLKVSPSTVSRLMSGKRSASAADVAGLAAVCRIPRQDRAWALHLAENLTPTWLQPYGTTLPEQNDILTHAESTATCVTEYQPLAIPELLQVADYAHLHIQATQHTSHDQNQPDQCVDQRVDQRMARQVVLDPPLPTDPDLLPPLSAQFRFLIDQRVLNDPRIPTDVMSEQIHHLIRLSVLPHVTLLVIPTNAPAAPWGCTPFRLFEFDDQRPAVCLTTLNSVLVLEGQTTVGQYRQTLAHLAATTNQTASDAYLTATGRRLSHQAHRASPHL